MVFRTRHMLIVAWIFVFLSVWNFYVAVLILIGASVVYNLAKGEKTK